jgi:uncharacterized protein
MKANAGRRQRAPQEIAFYILCRRWHGYLSAFAFLVLIFFSATGILINHPDWLSSDEPQVQTAQTRITSAEIAAARRNSDFGEALGATLSRHTALVGAYASADIDGRQALLRFEGVKGTSDVTLDLTSGVAQVRVKMADMVTMLDDLHRGKNAGPTWQAVIDISAALILTLSLVGYMLFFSMNYRLRTSLILTAAGLAALGGIFIFLVP